MSSVKLVADSINQLAKNIKAVAVAIVIHGFLTNPSRIKHNVELNGNKRLPVHIRYKEAEKEPPSTLFQYS